MFADAEKLFFVILGAVLSLTIVSWFFMFLIDAGTEREAIDRCYKAGGYCKELPRSKCSCFIPGTGAMEQIPVTAEKGAK